MSSLLLSQLVIFRLDDRRYALPLSVVERVIRAVAIALLPKAPGIVLGVINLRGRIIPVANLRRRFRLPERHLRLSDHFIIALTSRRVIALVVDAVTAVTESSGAARRVKAGGWAVPFGGLGGMGGAVVLGLASLARG